MRIKKIICLVLCTIMCITLAACGNNEYKLSKNILDILKRDQVVVEVSASADVADTYMQELSRKYDADFLAVVSDLLLNGIYAEIQMDNYNGEYEVAIYSGNSSDRPITTLKSVKSGAYINIKQLADFLGRYSIYKEASQQMLDVMDKAEYVRYDYYTNLDKYEYRKLTSLASDIMSTINQCMSQNVYVSSNREKLYFKWTPDVEDTVKSNLKRALFTKDIVGEIQDDILKWLRSASLEDLRVVLGDDKITKEEIKENIQKKRVNIEKDLKDNYEKYVEKMFEFSDYWDFTYTDGTYYDSSSKIKDKDELGRIELYNYTNGSSNGREKAQYGNKDIKVDLQVVFRKLNNADDDADSYFSNKLGKLVVTPSSVINADIVKDELYNKIKDVDISSKYDGIDLDIDVNGYKTVTSMDDEDDKVYKSNKMLPLRSVGESLGMTVNWNTDTSTPEVIYKTESGMFIKQNNFNYRLISGKTYVEKSYFEKVLGYELFVIGNKVCKK